MSFTDAAGLDHAQNALQIEALCASRTRLDDGQCGFDFAVSKGQLDESLGQSRRPLGDSSGGAGHPPGVFPQSQFECAIERAAQLLRDSAFIVGLERFGRQRLVNQPTGLLSTTAQWPQQWCDESLQFLSLESTRHVARVRLIIHRTK